MSKSQTHCVMPHIGLAVQNNGDFCVCNVNDASFKTNNHEVMFVHKDQLSSAWNSYTRRMIGAALDRDRAVTSCKTCFDFEAAGKKSQRIMFNEQYSNVAPLGNQPRVLILKPGNTCNLACRMCNAETSSGWYRDSHAVAQLNGDTRTLHEYTEKYEHIRNGFSKHNTQLWETFVEWMSGIEQLDIYGGEPMLMPTLFDSLEQVQHKTAKLTLHTNGTIFNTKYLRTLASYRSVDLHISIDSDCAEELEYIRYPANAELIFSNIKRYRDFFAEFANVKLSITVTVTPFNVVQIDRIVAGLKLYDLPVSLNFVTDPIEYDIRNMPNKAEIANGIRNNDAVKNFLLQDVTDPNAWESFLSKTQQLDTLRSQSYEKVFGTCTRIRT